MWSNISSSSTHATGWGGDHIWFYVKRALTSSPATRIKLLIILGYRQGLSSLGLFAVYVTDPSIGGGTRTDYHTGHGKARRMYRLLSSYYGYGPRIPFYGYWVVESGLVV